LTDGDTSELSTAGFSVAAQLGDVATLETDIDRLPDLASIVSVRKIFASVYRYALNDRARRNIRVEDLSSQRLVTQTGRGVAVGIIDSGIDLRHLDFTVPGSNGRETRIKALLDMTVYGTQSPDPSWNYSLPGQSALIGRLYSAADINAALQVPKPADQNSDLVKERDKNGHGTHVAATAAGNGLSSPTPGTYAGMAPEADLIIVKASRQNDGSASFRTTDIINALQFIQTKGTELGEPFVINLSLGGQSGPHDGTDPDERAIDNLVNGGPGRAVCVAAGNEGDANIHALATVPPGGSIELDFSTNNTPQFIDLYQANSDRFSVTVTRPDGGRLGPVSYDPNGFTMPNGQASDQYLQVFNANDDKGDSDPANDQPDIFIVFKAGAPNGTWKITLQDADANPNASFDAWAGGGDVSFTNFVDNSSHLVASPGTARSAITVGAFVTRSAGLVNGAFTPYTSPGPTADGRQKPEVEAPGHYLYSAKSMDITSLGVLFVDQLPSGDPNAATDYIHYGGLAGTSMSTAVTTGAVALFLQSNPSLSSAQIKNSLENTTLPDPFAIPGWTTRAGFGQLNIADAIQLGGRPVYTISGRVTNPSPNGLK
jgi:minor extracellular serine protease Vpr